MRSRVSQPNRLNRLMVLACMTAVVAACDDDATGPGMDDFESSPLFDVTVMQVDRFGFPAINTAFVSARPFRQ